MEFRPKRTQTLICILLAAVMLLPGSISSAAVGGRVHPLVAQIALTHPNQVVAVIVQSVDLTDGLRQAVKTLGGTITRDLSIIHSFSARMPASAAVALGKRTDVKWISLDAVVEKSAAAPTGPCTSNPFPDTTGARSVWNMGLKGEQVRVAVIDSGVANNADLNNLFQKSFNPNSSTINDVFGHGTHVAGIVGGDGSLSSGKYVGIAPGVDIINLKVSDETGQAYESDVVAALQWVYDNKNFYNIRVVNLSLNSSVEQSYLTSPLDAAVEVLWFNSIVVVVSAGNTGVAYNTLRSAPANDPFVITVGASNEACTSSPNDDTLATFSPIGVTQDGFAKPELLAPGTDIISLLSAKSQWSAQYPERVLSNGDYFRASGTSMAAPMVAGAAALLLQDEPNLTPDQVKYRLVNASNTIKVNRTTILPSLNVYKAVTGTSNASANTGITASQLLWTGTEPPAWNSISWNSISWNSISWNSISWNSISWNSISWNSVTFK